MRKNHMETIAENDNGDWIEVSYDKKGNPEFYVLFFADNMVTITVTPDIFKSIKELFWGLTKDLEFVEGEDINNF
jgi:hypothetical protein